MMEKGVRISSYIEGMEKSTSFGDYTTNSPMGTLVENVRRALAEYLLLRPKANGRNMKMQFEFEDGLFLIYGVKYDKSEQEGQ
ncbi:hypothetical protein LCGC14_2054790 [marine sediment metagenome]|uniref:Uncharacterized protein n=1 Tax=marine sediment metagenome TaxID=412755 RepID=A0A0F9FAE4_9ZZZZ|nr:hypothetical protein [bacterium]